MFKDVSKYYLVAWSCFILGIMSLMLNVFSKVFSIIFSTLFMIGLISLLIRKIIDYREFKKELTNTKESMAIDMTLSDSGSFEMKDTTLSKGQLREFKAMKRDKFMPIPAIILMFALMAFLTYKLLT